MLARLQRATTLGLLALAAGWAVWALSNERAGLAAGGALLIVFGYALVLGFEFVCVARVHRDDPAPRARARQLFAAWLGEVHTAPRVFCWQQPFRSRRFADRVPAAGAAAPRRGVVLVHGFVCNRGVWNRWLARLHADGVPVVAPDLEPVFGSIDRYPPLIDAAVRRLEAATGLAPVVVAHSMGGLAVRAWLDAFGADGRAHRVITIATPHHGTWLARWALSANTRQMRRGGAWLAALAAREPRERYWRFTCFHGNCDNIVFPASTATLPGADNRHLAGVAHVEMVDQPEAFSELRRWLDDGRPLDEASSR